MEEINTIISFSGSYLQQSFFLTKIALKIFQKKCPIDFAIVIYNIINNITKLMPALNAFQLIMMLLTSKLNRHQN